MRVEALKRIDKAAGAILALALSSAKKRKRIPERPKRILAIQLWGIGETILTLPAFSHLRKRFPNARIDVLCTERNRSVYELFEGVDGIVVLETGVRGLLRWLREAVAKKDKRYDVAIDFEEYLNVSSILAFFSAKTSIGFSHGKRAKLYDAVVGYNDRQHVVRTFEELLKPLGITERSQELKSLKLRKKDKKRAENKLKKTGIRNGFAIVAPGAAESSKARMWPLERYAELCQKIAKELGIKVLVTGSRAEKEICDFVARKAGKGVQSLTDLSVPELVSLVSRAMVVVSNDSGTMHIGAAQKTPTIGLFGPNTPARFGPFGKGNRAVYKKEACRFSPCINVHRGETPDCLFPKQSSDYQKCMRAISVGEVFGLVKELLGKG